MHITGEVCFISLNFKLGMFCEITLDLNYDLLFTSECLEPSIKQCCLN